MNLYNIDELVELFHNLLEHLIGSVDDDGEESLVLVETNRQRLDVVSSPREHAGDSVNHSALVPNEHRNRVPPNPATSSTNAKTRITTLHAPMRA